MVKNSKIYFLSALLSSPIISFSMQSRLLPDSLNQLTHRLDMLSAALKKVPREEVHKKVAIELTEEDRQIIQNFADKHSMNFNDALRRMVLMASSGVCPETPQPATVSEKVSPPPPPPAAPPPQPITQPTKVTVPKPSEQKDKKPLREEGIRPPSQEQILKGRGSLKKTGALEKLLKEPEEFTQEQKNKSDILFLQAFRDASSIDEIIENLRNLKNNLEYLKRENLEEPEKVTLTKSGAIPTSLEVKKVQIIDLLKKKSKLIITILKSSQYLKDYLFDTDELNEDDFEHIKDLIQEEIKKKAFQQAQQEEQKYMQWQEVLDKIIFEAKNLDDVINFIRAFPLTSTVKFFPNLVIKLKNKSLFIAIGADDLTTINDIEKMLDEESVEAFVNGLKKIITDPDLQNKVDKLLQAYKENII